jgi:aryl-alcohol dehydrogenase-like predicted oxidoreductase
VRELGRHFPWVAEHRPRDRKSAVEMKAAGAVRYVGITTSERRRHDLLEQIMRSEPIDFVQFSYNVVDREAEKRLLPLASERGIAVIVNRPFRQGALTQRLKDEPLPEWAAERGASSWSQLILKFILSHPAVTVAIPATCACRQLDPGILVMQPAQDWATKNVLSAIGGARDRCILLQSRDRCVRAPL